MFLESRLFLGIRSFLSYLLFQFKLDALFPVSTQWTHFCRFAIDLTSKFHNESLSIFCRLLQANLCWNNAIGFTWISQSWFDFQNRLNFLDVVLNFKTCFLAHHSLMLPFCVLIMYSVLTTYPKLNLRLEFLLPQYHVDIESTWRSNTAFI